ncbi:MAG: signal peptidase II [Acidocella sp. 20-57-95]|nr:MAG: signal peptidase II [Acidocella sp. 20-57-95]OYV59003.1 MAG: signal peptidase II [Acidocella sp. 21-58-7]HQT63769.1 signal peptidase II [Acidocella sp.]HQU05480.1 signal peptidase II [Acidocella sp.]
MKRRLTGILLGLIVLAADQASKWAVLHPLNLTDGHFLVLLPVLNFVLVWNHGVTFGMFNGEGAAGTIILAAVAIAVVSALIIWLWNTKYLTTTLAIGAIAGGATGNVLDRLHYGAVVDFIQAHIGPYSWYVFNVGDAAIVCGVGVLMAESLLRGNAGSDRKAP